MWPLPGQIEPVHAAAIARDEAVFWVTSNGCTAKEDITPIVRASNDGPIITLRRIKEDRCLQTLPDGAAALQTLFAELAAEPGQSQRTRQALQAFSAFVQEQVVPHADAGPDQPFWLADDFLRSLALLLMAWAWDRLATAPDVEATAHAAFWRWVWPEFDMRMGMMNTTLKTGQPAPAML